MIHFPLHLVRDLLHNTLALELKLIEETSSEVSHVTVTWEENIANHTLSFEVFCSELIHITTTYIFLVKAGHVAMPNLKRVKKYLSGPLCPEKDKLKSSIPSLTAIAFP